MVLMKANMDNQADLAEVVTESGSAFLFNGMENIGPIEREKRWHDEKR